MPLSVPVVEEDGFVRAHSGLAVGCAHGETQTLARIRRRLGIEVVPISLSGGVAFASGSARSELGL